MLEVGAGTGKFTQRLRQTGAVVTAAEPVAAIGATLTRLLPQLRALDAAAQSLPLSTASPDVVTCGESFHWFAQRAALLEFHRLLVRRGRPGLIWNLRDEAVDWVAALERLLRVYQGERPRFTSGEWRRVVTGELFSPLQTHAFAFEHVGSPQQVIIARSLSGRFIACLPAEELLHLRGQIEQLIRTHPQLRGRDRIACPDRTHAYQWERLDDDG